jgi:2-polyprenyl-3-methyl-5-hydroxy-6-metoxy-1,4-benzoquinol methylase
MLEESVISAEHVEALKARLDALEKRNVELSTMVEYLHYWAIRSDENIRDITSRIGGLPEAERDTRGIFEFKWQQLNKGVSSLENPEHRAVIADTVLRWTGLDRAWFQGKRALDAGCGDGRLSYGLCSLGATVTSMDQSSKGIERTVAYCREFAGHRGIVWNLLDRYEAEPANFDLVLSFGVTHCTGDTRKSLANLDSLVKPGGYLAIMVYGYPRVGFHGDFVHMVRKERVRQAIRHMTGEEAVAYIESQLEAGAIKGDARGWYDATAPRVEDHYTFPQVSQMMQELGYTDIVLLDESIRNIAVRGRKPE